MRKRLNPLIAICLIPCLILDPATVALATSGSPPRVTPLVSEPFDARFREEAFIQRVLFPIQTYAVHRKAGENRLLTQAVFPGASEFFPSLRRDFLSRWHRGPDGTIHPAQKIAWGMMWAAMAAAVIAVFYGIPGWVPPSNGVLEVMGSVLERVPLANMTVHITYNALAMYLGWPLLMIPKDQPVEDIWSVRNGPGFGREFNRALTEAEANFHDDLALHLNEDHGIDLEHADLMATTLLTLKGGSLQTLKKYKVLDDVDGNVFRDLTEKPTEKESQAKEIKRLATKLAALYTTYARELGTEETNYGFDEAMLSTLLSTHLLPWGEMRRFQRTYHLGRDLAMVREALDYGDVEQHILDRQTLKELPGGRAPIPHLHREPLAFSITDRKNRAVRLVREFEERIEMLDYVQKLQGAKLAYDSLQPITDHVCNIIISGSDPIPLWRKQIIKFEGRYDVDFLVTGIDPETRQVSLTAMTGLNNPVGRLAQQGKILLGDDRDMEQKEQKFLHELLKQLKAYLGTPVPSINEAFNSLLGLAPLAARDRHPERQDYQPVGSIQYVNKQIGENISQATAVQMSFDPPRILSVEGPAATAKTEVGVEIAQQWARRGKKVLYLSQMHASVDEAGSRLKGLPILRVGNLPGNFEQGMERYWPGKPEDIQQDVLDEFGRKREALSQELGHEAGYVVMATNAGIVTDSFSNAARHKKFPNLDMDFKDFDLIIMDEASRETLQGALLPLQYLKEDGKLVVLGDIKQLGPHGMGGQEKAFRKAYRQTKPAVEESTLDRLVQVFHTSFQEWLHKPENIDVPRIMLSTNYRQHPLNGRLTSEASYEGEVHVKGFEDFDENTLRIVDLKDLADPNARNGFYEKSEEIDAGQISFYNETAIKWDIKLVHEYRKRFGPAFPLDRVTIVTPYVAQVFRLEEALRKAFPGEKVLPVVTTIDSYQGGQNQYVIFDLTRSNKDFDIGLLRDVRRITVGISRDQKEKVIVCDTRMFLSKAALALQDDKREGRLMLRKIIKFYADEVIPFFGRKKITKAETDAHLGGDPSATKAPPPPGNLLEAVRGDKTRAELLTVWDKEFLPLFGTSADLRHAHVSIREARYLQSADKWPIGIWWWDMLLRWEEANWDQATFEDHLIEHLGGRAKLDSRQIADIRAWAGLARQRCDTAYLHLVGLCKHWSTTIVLDETKDLDALRWLYSAIPSTPLRRDIRNQFTEHVKHSLHHWREHVEDLLVYEKLLADAYARLNAAAPEVEGDPGPALGKEQRDQYDEMMRKSYADSVRALLVVSSPWKPDWEKVGTCYVSDSRLLKKAVTQEVIAWGKNRLTLAGEDVGRIRETDRALQEGLAVIERTGSEGSARGMRLELEREEERALDQVAMVQLRGPAEPEWPVLRDLYEQESTSVRSYIENHFATWGRGVIDHAGLDEETVAEAFAKVEHGISAMNPENATIPFEGTFLARLRSYGEDHIQQAAAQAAANRAREDVVLKIWQQDGLRDTLHFYGVRHAKDVPLQTLQKVWKIAWSDLPNLEKVAQLRSDHVLVDIAEGQILACLRAVRQSSSPDWNDDIISVSRAARPVRDEMATRIEFYQRVGSKVKQHIDHVAASSKALVFLPDPFDLYAIPDELLLKFSKIDIVTTDVPLLAEVVEKKCKIVRERARTLLGDERRSCETVAVALEKKVRAISVTHGLMLSSQISSEYLKIAQEAQSLEDAELRLSALLHRIRENPEILGSPEISDNLDKNYDYTLSVGVVPVAMMEVHIGFERQLIRHLIEKGAWPDEPLPVRLQDLRLAWAKEETNYENLIDSNKPEELSPTLNDLKDLLVRLYVQHHQLECEVINPTGLVGILTYEGLRARPHTTEADQARWEQMPAARHHPLGIWYHTAASVISAEAGHYKSPIGDLQFYTKIGSEQMAVFGRLMAHSAIAREAYPGAFFLASPSKPSSRRGQDARVEASLQLFLRNLYETIGLYDAAMDSTELAVLHAIRDRFVAPLVDVEPDRNALIWLPTPRHIEAIPDEILIRRKHGVFLLTSHKERLLGILQNRGPLYKKRLETQNIQVFHSAMFSPSAKTYERLDTILKSSRSISEMLERCLSLLLALTMNLSSDERRIKIPERLRAGLVLAINVIPLSLALWALTIERMAGAHAGKSKKNLPMRFEESQWSRLEFPGEEPTWPPFFKSMQDMLTAWVPYIIRNAEDAVSSGGQILITTPIGPRIFLERPGQDALALTNPINKFETTSSLAWWHLINTPWYNLINMAREMLPGAVRGLMIPKDDSDIRGYVAHGLAVNREELRKLCRAA